MTREQIELRIRERALRGSGRPELLGELAVALLIGSVTTLAGWLEERCLDRMAFSDVIDPGPIRRWRLARWCPQAVGQTARQKGIPATAENGPMFADVAARIREATLHVGASLSVTEFATYQGTRR